MKTFTQTSRVFFQPFQPKRGAFYWIVLQTIYFLLTLPLFGPRRVIFRTSGCGKWPKMVCLDVFIGGLTFYHPFQPKKGPSGPICVAKKLFLAYFCPCLAPIGPHLWNSGSGIWPKLINLYLKTGSMNLAQTSCTWCTGGNLSRSGLIGWVKIMR